MAIVLVIFPVDGGYIVDDVCPVLYAFLGLMFPPKGYAQAHGEAPSSWVPTYSTFPTSGYS